MYIYMFMHVCMNAFMLYEFIYVCIYIYICLCVYMDCEFMYVHVDMNLWLFVRILEIIYAYKPCKYEFMIVCLHECMYEFMFVCWMIIIM